MNGIFYRANKIFLEFNRYGDKITKIFFETRITELYIEETKQFTLQK